MAFLPYPPNTTTEVIAVLKQDVQIAHDIVHGDANTQVDTEGGLTPSFAKVIKDLTDEVNAATGVDVTLRAQLATSESTVLVGGIPAYNLPTLSDGLKGLVTRSGKPQFINSIYANGTYGGAEVSYLAVLSKTNHGKIISGYLHIAPEAIAAWNGAPSDIATLWNWTGTGAGCYLLKSNKISVLHFGADPTGANDSAPCISANAKAMSAGTIHLPAGNYRVNTSIQNLTSKINIHGEGSAVSLLLSYLSSGSVLAFSGLPSTNAYTSYKGFGVVSQVSAATAINPADAAYMLFEDIITENFALHWDLESVLTSTFIKCTSRFGPAGAIGLTALNTGTSNPNALTFQGCVFSSLSGAGLIFANPSRLTYVGGSVEACGSGVNGGMIIEAGGGQGPAGAYIQTYFEGNGGIADLWIKQNGVTQFTVDVSNSCFNRLPTPRYAENCIRMTQNVGSAFSSLRVGNGSAFRGFDTYAPDLSRKYVLIDSATSNYKYVDDGSNFFESDTEIPQISPAPLTYGASILVDMLKYSRYDHPEINITNGSAFTVQNPTNAKVGDVLNLLFRNTYGSAGSVTFGSAYRLGSAFTAPAINFGILISFEFTNLGLWIEKSRSSGFQTV
jgi:hypothetical protein